MLDIGWSELLVIGVVALIVVGPKDLPKMFRTLGEFTGKARRMAREFQNAMNDAADESGVGDVAKDLRKMANPKKFGMDALNDATGDLKSWTPDSEAAKRAPATKPGPYKAPDASDLDAAELAEEPALRPDPAAPKPADPKPAPTTSPEPSDGAHMADAKPKASDA
ncbi:Sec-independent protein translocase protein TatB [Jannaschia seosinensis]|uniref:Sec-independent protein translocase protein TatB n=1 Tax=Jannaschia seosinensis TaxID=313367 RepID=A0A0M7BFX7_9RHOB|nr:Sec-independent protein translocase protein TatB [Jannaschia seosinensis]CUH40285.1 Sec-independent protein translocase protein TatB [Jannaschia seosinensis]